LGILKLESRKRELDSVIQAKLERLRRAGVSMETLNLARRKVIDYLRTNTAAPKQLVILYAAAVYEASNDELTGVDGHKYVGYKIAERRLEDLFGITRKTIRSWRKKLTKLKAF
jgi:hypothetical protein